MIIFTKKENFWRNYAENVTYTPHTSGGGVDVDTVKCTERRLENNEKCASAPVTRIVTKGTREIDSFFSLFGPQQKKS